MKIPAVDVGAYLERIGYRGGTKPTAEVLKSIHRAHLLTVPFENLDIALGRPIEMDLDAFFDKIVVRRRGGFCYELNGLFGWLLRELRFPVATLSARVLDGGRIGPDFDHMLLLVRLEDRLIADVGFGDSFVEPVPMDGDEHVEGDRTYRVAETEWALTLERLSPGTDWEPQYAFNGAPRRLSDFAEMCRWQQTSPDSHFTQKTICSLPTEDGRITLSNDRWIETIDGQRTERKVTGPDEYRELLRTRFGIELDADAAIDTLMER
ncbi:MAG TPA: arylamine N-acetyltransferase [Candidatus Polarisedimenticolaceae bacterium]|nr:arylamine N-acetyltransferase [Candidatus Polarisedimenticolaceae bacterium]